MNVEQRARELLRSEYMLSLSGAGPKQRHLYECAIRAIIAALTPPDRFALVPVERGAMYVCPTCHGVGSVTQQVHDKVLAACPEVKND